MCIRCLELAWIAGLVFVGGIGAEVVEAKEPTAEDIARCEREKAAREKQWQDLYLATHPGHVGAIPPNPAPYICGPVPDDPPQVDLPDAGGARREYHGFDVPNRYADDMRVGSPRTGLRERQEERRRRVEANQEKYGSGVSTHAPSPAAEPEMRREESPAPLGEHSSQDQGADDVVVSGDSRRDDDSVGADSRESGSSSLENAPDSKQGEVPSPPGGDSNNDESRVVGSARFSGWKKALLGIVAALFAVAAVMCGIGVVGARRGRVWRMVIPWSNRRRQSLVLLEDSDSDREQFFKVDVPVGGQMKSTPEGGVVVVDAAGEVVSEIKAPWAVDAAGRLVETHYVVDDARGGITQVIVPTEKTVFPVLADPDEEKPSWWQKTKNAGSKVWGGTKNVAKKTWHGTKRVAHGVKTSVRKGAGWVGRKHTQARVASQVAVDHYSKSDSKVVRGVARTGQVGMHVGDGVYEVGEQTVEGTAPLVGMGADDGPGVAESWKEGPGALVGASDTVSVGQAWKQLGKDTVAWDEFARGEYAKGVGKAGTNILGLVYGGKGVQSVSRVGRVGRRVGRSLRETDRLEGGARRVERLEPTRPVSGDKVAPSRHEHSGPVREHPVTDVEAPGGDVPRTVPVPVDKKPAPVRGVVLTIPDSGVWKEYPNPQAVDHFLRNDLFLPPGSKPFGVDEHGRALSELEYAQTYLRRDPLARYPLAFDEGEKVVPRWREDVDRGFAADPPPVRRLLSEVPAGKLFARIGYPGGTNFTDPGVPFKDLAMPAHNLAQEYHVYELVDPSKLDDDWVIIEGKVAKDHAQPGGGPQYLFEGPHPMTGEIGIRSAKEIFNFKIFRELDDREIAGVLETIWKQMKGGK
ncbi:TNT domain-containing protein [Corynebacterium uropygiale]|uniref:TNT domain-containing protein n=1 Tax=Corynebacterium uropygiale TaxID=1775911 RepID=A0A9X1QRR2_9CORY|nr:TNT domain-containing protein [Corynebacterium uropygiale]MCF4007187.1 TNT domain-containing protein [Corynebacterium uropygiale]